MAEAFGRQDIPSQWVQDAVDLSGEPLISDGELKGLYRSQVWVRVLSHPEMFLAVETVIVGGKERRSTAARFVNAKGRTVTVDAGTADHIARVIADRLNRDCFDRHRQISLQTLIERSRRAKATVQNAVDALEHFGWLDIARGSQGKGHANAYRLTFPKHDPRLGQSVAQPLGQSVAQNTSQLGQPENQLGQSRSQLGHSLAPIGSATRHEEVRREEEKEEAPTAEALRALAEAATDPKTRAQIERALARSQGKT